MSSSAPEPRKPDESRQEQAQDILYRIKTDAENLDLIRKGVCLLNAGQYDDAESVYAGIMNRNGADQRASSAAPTATTGLAASLIGQGSPAAAADQFERMVTNDPSQTTARIRHALSLWASNQPDQAVASLREGVRQIPECAELHFQLGTLLTAREEYEEAELRFTQALNIEPDHTDALISYSLCCAVRNAPAEALGYLRRAQLRRPGDARIGLLLSQTARAVRQQGLSVRVRAQLPDDRPPEILGLVVILESDPEFADAFLVLPAETVDEPALLLLLRALQSAIERRRDSAELQYQCARVLDRLGRAEEAVKAHERAVELNPSFIRGLIELARLHVKAGRTADARRLTEQAISAGAEYADVYYLLGNIYRDEGRVIRARSAYKHALLLNRQYEAASQALEALPV